MIPNKYARTAVVEVDEIEEESLETTEMEELLAAEERIETGLPEDERAVESSSDEERVVEEQESALLQENDLEGEPESARDEELFAGEESIETGLLEDERALKSSSDEERVGEEQEAALLQENDLEGEPESAQETELVVEEVTPEEAAAVRLAARAASLSEARVQTICESLLFVADRPLTVSSVQAATGLEPRRIREAMEAITGRFREGVSGIVLHEVAGGWQLRSCPTSAEDLRRFLQVRPQRLTRAALETMSIVAYRQPVTRPEIEEIRGVDSGAVVKALLDRGLVQIIGKKEEPGRPLLYATTKAFLEFFNLKDLSSLPSLRELYELSEESTRIVEENFPEEIDKNERSIADLVEKALSVAVKDDRVEDESAIEFLDVAMRDAESASRAAGDVLGSKDRPEEETG